MTRYGYLTLVIVFDTLCALVLFYDIAQYNWIGTAVTALSIAIATTAYYVFIVEKDNP